MDYMRITWASLTLLAELQRTSTGRRPRPTLFCLSHGQRMDSSRFWNTIRNREDWERTRDLWDRAAMRVVDSAPGQYHYALGDASHANSPEKARKFTRELVYAPVQDLLFGFDRVVSANPSFKKAWLLHGVNQPSVDQEAGPLAPGSRDFVNTRTFRSCK
jgi:hypothetical protein